ncbi:MAG: 3-phosphoserine/phosphohydroxythreonine transaminase [Acidobacteriota bacterium]
MRVFNFSAGPATLPEAVLEEARQSLLSYGSSGRSVMELSHRSPEYDEIHRHGIDRLRRLLAVPENFEILLLQGGASLQFAMVPANLMHGSGRADYVLTGTWSRKAAAEARKVGEVRIAGSGEGDDFRRIPRPQELDFDASADFVHLTSNNTICGTQWRDLPETASVPAVVDMSSDILSRPIPWERVGLAYAGAQKNLGPAGVTLVIVRRDLMAGAPDDLPAMLDYRVHAAKGSLYNTPPTWSIYMLGLACRWVEEQGGLAAMEAASLQRSRALYEAIDRLPAFRGTAEVDSRSRMNVTFRLATEELEAEFLRRAGERRMTNLKGHRSVGGIRASLYNALPMAAVEALIELMEEFARESG